MKIIMGMKILQPHSMQPIKYQHTVQNRIQVTQFLEFIQIISMAI